MTDLKQLIDRMRNNGRFQVAYGGADVVWSNTVDDWVDELEALLAARAVAPQHDDHGHSEACFTGTTCANPSHYRGVAAPHQEEAVPIPQQDLPEAAARVLRENLWNLYDED